MPVDKQQTPLDNIRAIYNTPLFDLLDRARDTHRRHWPQNQLQLCTLLSIKTGGCSENCAYCSQSAHFDTGLTKQPLLAAEQIEQHARAARDAGATRFCMGAAWRGISHDSPQFPEVLEAVRRVRALGLEACVTLGSLTCEAAQQLKQAGLTAYNHNIDTSPEHYPNIVTTHTFADRLRTISYVQQAGISVCCGGILGMGESEEDRLRMLQQLTGFDPAPESIPINVLVPIPGTPLENAAPVPPLQLIRLIATTRILFPKAKVRLSAGRTTMSRELQTLALYAGANSIFYGDRLLTTPNPESDDDLHWIRQLDLKPEPPDQHTQPHLANRLFPNQDHHACAHQTLHTEHNSNITTTPAA